MDREGKPVASDPEPEPDMVLTLFEEARALAPAERGAFLQARSGGDAVLLAEVQGLLEADARAGNFLAGPLAVDDGTPPSADLTTLDAKYEVLGLIATGGMGLVYKVRHRLLDRPMAIKIVRPDLQRSESLRRRFLREAKLATGLSHPNVASIHDFHLDAAGNAVLVMEYLEGWDLRDVLAGGRVLPLPLALSIAAQALRALGHLHDRELVHRDVAPDNFMLVRGPAGEPHVKMIDLGIAKPFDDQGSLTQAGLFLGKVLYSAPEAFGPEGPVRLDARSDLYAFGVILYQLLTGRVPIAGTDQRSLMSGHLLHPPRPFADTDAAGRVPDELRTVVMRMLAKEPDDRFPAAAEPLAVLERELEKAGPVPAGWEELLPPPSAASPVNVGVPRSPVAVADVLPASRERRPLRWAVPLLALLAIVAVAWWMGTRRPTLRQTAAPERVEPAASTGPPAERSPADDPATASAGMVAVGWVRIDVQPWGRVARVWPADGGPDVPLPVDVTPCALELPAGTYRVRVEHPRFPPMEEMVRVEPGVATSFHRSFEGFDVEAMVARYAP